jgi:hypothetical protein
VVDDIERALRRGTWDSVTDLKLIFACRHEVRNGWRPWTRLTPLPAILLFVFFSERKKEGNRNKQQMAVSAVGGRQPPSSAWPDLTLPAYSGVTFGQRGIPL